LPIKSRKLLYNALIRPHITYGIELWGNTNGTLMRKLITKQKKVLRLLSNNLIHTGPIRKKNGILNIREEYSRSMDTLGWKLMRNLAPSTLKDGLTWRDLNVNLRVINKVVIPRYRQEKLRMQFLPNLAKAINGLNEELNWSISIFKKRTKKKYINGINGIINCSNIDCRECNQ
jgi:hypothetical protein